MEHYNRPDLQAIEEEITLLANESTMTKTPTELWQWMGSPLQKTVLKLEIV